MNPRQPIHHMRRRSSLNGFTLIELLLVLVILAILAAVIVPKFTGRTLQAQQSAAKADISALDTQLARTRLTMARCLRVSKVFRRWSRTRATFPAGGARTSRSFPTIPGVIPTFTDLLARAPSSMTCSRAAPTATRAAATISNNSGTATPRAM